MIGFLTRALGLIIINIIIYIKWNVQMSVKQIALLYFFVKEGLMLATLSLSAKYDRINHLLITR
jgi:hypothetical protein